MDQTPYTPGAPVPPVPPATAPSAQPTYAKGCLAAAWTDIKETPGYAGKLAVLGLIMCVPILNFVVLGYLLLWSREVPFGGKTPLPAQYVTGKHFEFGFYAFVIALVVGLVTGVAGWILGIIPVLGWIAYMAVALAGAVAVNLMQMRMVMGYTIGDGFAVKDLWNVAKRKPGELVLVTLVPGIVAGAAVSVLAIILVTLAMLVGLGGAMPTLAASSYAGSTSLSDVLAVIGLIAGPALFAGLIAYIIGNMVETVASALTARGLGHWVARYAPEWTALVAPVPPTVPPTGPAYPQTPGMPQ